MSTGHRQPRCSVCIPLLSLLCSMQPPGHPFLPHLLHVPITTFSSPESDQPGHCAQIQEILLASRRFKRTQPWIETSPIFCCQFSRTQCANLGHLSCNTANPISTTNDCESYISYFHEVGHNVHIWKILIAQRSAQRSAWSVVLNLCSQEYQICGF